MKEDMASFKIKTDDLFEKIQKNTSVQLKDIEIKVTDLVNASQKKSRMGSFRKKKDGIS